MTSLEKIAYLNGLVAGMDYDFKGDEGKILKGVLDALETIASEISDVKEDIDYNNTELAVMNEDLLRVENRLYNGKLAERLDSDEFAGNDLDDETDNDENFEDEDDDRDYFVICPSCGERLGLDDEDLERGSKSCPTCSESLEFDIDEAENCCDCGCDHNHIHEDVTFVGENKPED